MSSLKSLGQSSLTYRQLDSDYGVVNAKNSWLSEFIITGKKHIFSWALIQAFY